MPRKARELAAVAVQRLSTAGLHAVGGVAGLYLQVQASGARSWILRAKVGAKRRDMGLGGFPDVPLAQARDRARIARLQIQQGEDPIAHRRAVREQLTESQRRRVTFKQVAEQCLEDRKDGWSNAKHRAQWATTLETYAYKVLGELPVADIAQLHVEQVLRPIWAEKTETASRVRARIEAVLGYAASRGYCGPGNAARWKGQLEHVFPAPRKVKKARHHRALPFADAPNFMRRLRAQVGVAAKALEFTILTATRTGEVIGGSWQELDLRNNVWTIPAERMKGRREHRVPLSAEARAVLDALPRPLDPAAPLFASRGPSPLSNMAMTEVLRRMKVDATVHGFRSTFKDWATENTEFDNIVSEMALAHHIESKAEKAYRRGDLLERRKQLMSEWSNFLNSQDINETHEKGNSGGC